MRLKFMIITAVAAAMTAVAASAAIDYTCGVFIVNEDWYGHQNSTVNYLLPDDPDGDYWHYRVIQSENPGVELGCTNQFGALWQGRFYLIAKQEKDPGASVTGGRITVADARTMKVLHQSELIDPSGAQCDGRGFVGVDAHKGYVSTSNGVWILDLDTYQIRGQVQGTDNPNAGDDKPNTDPTGSLYHGQCGSMVTAAGKVFVAHQQHGLLVVDPATDRVVHTISMSQVSEKAGIGSVVKALDGSLWLSVAANVQGTGAVINSLVRVDPATLQSEVVPLPEGIFGPANSWYAWTPDAFCASSVTNSLYWQGGSNSWFSGYCIYRFDVDSRTAEKIIDLKADGENWKLYGCSMRLHPVTDEIYASLYHEFSMPTYITRRYTADGVKIRDYEMIANYWFPSLPVFPQAPDAQTRLDDVRQADVTEEVYTLSGLRITAPLSSLPSGVYIVRHGSTTTKILITKNAD